MKSKNRRLADWRLTRERFYISDPFPPRPRHPAKAIGEVLSEIRSQQTASGASPELLKERWVAIVGEQIAQHTHPDHLRGTQLVVYADHPGWLTEVRRLPTRHLLKRIASIPGSPEIKAIRFQLDPAIQITRR